MTININNQKELLPVPLFLVLALIIPPALAASVFFNKKFEECMPLFLLSLITAGYFFAICGGVRFFPYVFYSLWLASAAYLIYALVVKKKRKPSSLISLGFIMFMLFAAVLWWLCRGRLLTFWDDFSHWGLSIKNMYYLNDIYTNAASSATYLDYPPAAQILQYTILKAGRFPFREDVAVFVHCLLYLSLIIYPLSRFSYKTALPGVFLAFFLFFLTPSINTGAYTRLLVDGLMGVICAYILLSWFLSEKDNFAIATGILACFVLSVTKAAGFGLAIMAAVIILADKLIAEKEKTKAAWRKSKAACLIFYGASPFLASFAAWGSWEIHKIAYNVPKQWNVSALSLGGIIEMLKGNGPEYRYISFNNFINTFFKDPGHGWLIKFPTVGWLLIGIALFFVTRLLLPKEKRKSFTVGSVGVLAVFIIFMASLMLNYMFVFSEGEGKELAHFYRYQTTVSIAVQMYFAASLFTAIQYKKPWQQALLCLCSVFYSLLCFTELPYFAQNLLKAPTYAAQTHHDRAFSIQNAQRVKQLNEDNPRLYLISVADYRWALMQLIYELTPMQISDPWQNTSPAAFDYYSDRVAGGGAEIISPEDFGRRLYDGFDYVYLFSIDGYFTSYYRGLFENEDDIVNDTMLEVIRHGDGSVSLRKLF